MSKFQVFLTKTSLRTDYFHNQVTHDIRDPSPFSHGIDHYQAVQTTEHQYITTLMFDTRSAAEQAASRINELVGFNAIVL